MRLPTRPLAAFVLAFVAWASALPGPVRADGAPSGLFWPSHLPYPVTQHHGPFEHVHGLFLKPAAAAALEAMLRAARYEGVYILPRSGFRSHAHQSRLFFEGAKRLGITLLERARVSAPPGFSEHHTGYAVDLDDAHFPVFLGDGFDETPAGRWLLSNAHRFCFELSFPKGNPQGIDYEPWHWRFVGTAHALDTFARARRRFPGLPGSLVTEAAAGPDDRLICRAVERVEIAAEAGIEVASDANPATAISAAR